ncbi:MAG: PAS domain S-box protein, partial [Candidatus Marinimicrobia bacterium]|nr:PAS domain S-box protein [Candidatus Neomarinimicrobiota bacterium]
MEAHSLTIGPEMNDNQQSKAILIEELGELRVKSARLEAQNQASIDGTLVVDARGKVVSANDRMRELWGIPKRIWEARDQALLLKYAAKQLRNPQEFKEQVDYLYAHPEEKIRDEIELKDGRTFDRYSAPLIDAEGTNHGRIWYFRDISERKAAEAALRESEERFKAIFEHAPDGMYLHDLKGVFLDGNLAAEDLIGYKREELIGKSFLKLGLLSALQIPKAALLLAKNVLGRPTGPDEIVLTQKDGGSRSVEISTFPVMINHTRAVLGIARDITKRKAAEASLKENEERLRNLYHSIPLAYFAGDKQGRIIDVNKRAEELLGYSRDEIIGRNAVDLYADTPNGKPKVAEISERVSAGEAFYGEELEMLRSDGSSVWVSLSVEPEKGGQARRAMVEDISERKAAEAALRESEERYRTLFDAPFEAIAISDQCRIVDA